MHPFIQKNKNYIILLGHVIGALYVLEFLPEKLSFAAAYTDYIYVGAILFSAYVYYTSYMQIVPQRRMQQQQRPPVRPPTRRELADATSIKPKMSKQELAQKYEEMFDPKKKVLNSEIPLEELKQ